MLYIFQVDTGQMLCFEMNIAISTVHNLKSTIAQTHGIPIDKQVLLVSGGEILEPNSRVCNYAAGTDTNPIFLFNKLNIEGGGVLANQGLSNEIVLQHHQQGSSSILDGNNVQMADQETINLKIEQANSLPPTYVSVVNRAQLAQHIYEMGKEITRKCELLIHHQHLQHQGWAAVVANLDDIVTLFNSKLQGFVSAYEGFVGEFTKDKIDAFVDSLEPTLKVLDSIKLKPYTTSSTPAAGTDNNNQYQATLQPQSIVNWLSQHYQATASNHSSTTNVTPLHTYLNSLAMSTRKTYDHITTENFLQSLQQEASSVSEKASSPNMKEINGLEARLYGLDQLLQEAKHIVVDQHELTQAFQQNVSRAGDLRDSSIFPDLCASHQHQLLVMQKNHGQLEDIRRRCAKAKEELTFNLNTRLKWIAFVQKNLSETGGKIGVFHESLKRLRVNLNVLMQMHECEGVYKEYTREVQLRSRVARKLKNLVAGMVEFNGIVERENRRRDKFRSKYGFHFLSQAFSLLIEDRGVETVAVPKLVEYHWDGGGLEQDDDDDEFETNEVDEEKLRLSARVKELEVALSVVKGQVTELEDKLVQSSAKVRAEQTQKNEAISSAAVEKRRNEKLTSQVDNLKKLLDEFRVKEDENIRVHAQEVAEFNRKLAEEQRKCEERAVELQRMLEFECHQKIKGVEESHRMEFDAMVKRFKLVNRSVGFGGSSEKIPVGNVTASAAPPPQKQVLSDDSDSEGTYADQNTGSLERAVDALMEQDDEEAARSPVCSASATDVGIHESVINTASRLSKVSRISISACRVGGDANLFYFNEKFNAFTVYLSNRNVHFLNTSSAEDEFIKTLKRTQMFIANITDKEFCVARRPQNRYNVPQGFHFYRVKCKVIEVLEE